MISYNARKLFAEIESVVKSGLPVTEGLQRIIQFCERERPHPDWSALRALDVDGALPRLWEWLEAIMQTMPPPAQVTGLWFGSSGSSRRVSGPAFSATQIRGS